MSEKKKDKFHRFTREEINNLPGRELKSRRTRSSKTYSLGNGLYQAVIYPDAIHYRNEKGEWEDIDHSLTKENGSLCDHSGDLAVTLARGGCVTLKKDNHRLSWEIRGVAPAEAVPDNASTKFPRHNKKLRTENKVTYSNIFPDVDFVCDLKPNQFKDTLIFKKPEALRPVEFLIRAENLVLRQAASGAVVAMCGDDTIFRLPAPCAVDEYGDAVPSSANAVLTQISDHEWCWTCEVSADYAANAVYPLRLDPVVETQQSANVMSMAYTSSAQPDEKFPGTGYSVRVSHNNSTYGKCCTYLRFEYDPTDADKSALPLIDSSYYVTAAELTMRTTYNGSSTPVYIKEVLSEWEPDDIYYNKRPSVADDAMEYYVAPASSGKYLYFNITNLVRKWYNGKNNGLMLETLSGNMVQLGGTGATYAKPYITITYISLAGLESYLQQDSISCGRAGTAHIGLFNGNLVFSHQETSMNGNLMPVSIGRYYNSCYHDINAFHAGNGWKFSTQQTLHKETIDSTIHYVYMDGDGTRHFFKKTNGKWKDLSGLQLTMEIADSTATISDKGGNKMHFPLPENEFLVNGAETYTNVTWITAVENACGTKAEFVHAKAIGAAKNEFAIGKDGAGRTTMAMVNSDQMVTQIQAPGMDAMVYEYNAANQLTKITHPDESATEYGYNSVGLLETITNSDNSGIKIVYHDGTPYRVKEVQMFDTSKKVYAIRRYEYGDCCTTVNELYPDGTDTDGNPKYGEGKPLHYHFNDAGNLISVNDELGYGYFAGYSDEAPANHPDYTSKLQRSVNNYLKNHHFLTTTNNDWIGDLMDGAGECSYSSEMNYAGGRAYRLMKTSEAGTISVYQNVTLKKNRSYTFSCQYKTLNRAEVQLQVEWKDSTGADGSATSPAFACTDRWNRTHVSFTLPDDETAQNVTVRIIATGGVGKVWADAAQVEDGLVPNRYNLLENANFYMNDTGRPLYWNYGDDVEDTDGVTTDIAEGRPSELIGNAVRLKGAYGDNKVVYQEMSCIGSKGDTFVAGGWSCSHCRPRNGNTPTVYEMEVLARPLPADVGLSSSQIPSFRTVGHVMWSEEWSGWQFAAIPIVMPWRYTAVKVQMVYQNNLNEAQFSNLFLHKEEFGRSFAYDSNGNITSVKNLAAIQSGSEYDDYDNLISYHQPGRSEEYELEWGSKTADKKLHLLRKTTSPLNIVQRTIYDTRTATDDNPVTTLGLPEKTYTEAIFVNDNGNTCRRFIAAETGYTADKNYVSTSTDARKKVVSTVTDPSRGIVNSVTDPKGQAVAYTYDTMNRVTKVSTTTAGAEYRNQYVYENDLLKQVQHNTSANEAEDVVYTFEYDSKNRRTGVKVGNQHLSKNEYADTAGPQYGVLARSVYCNSDANPQVVHYTYDDFKRMTSIRYGNESENKKYSFDYGANGQVARVTNHELNRVVLSEYDVANRPMRITHMEGNNHVYTGEVTYDEHNNLARFEESVGSTRTAYSTAFTYDVENKPTLLKYNNSSADKVAYTYDELGRTAKRTVTVNGHASETNYAYLAGAQTYTPENADDDKPTYATTGLIESITQPGGNFTYNYDDNGNITRVVQDGKNTYYAYDALGQLVRVDDQNDTTSGSTGTTWVYAYDQGGNILSKKRYVYTEPDVEITDTTPVQDMVAFSYTNANWKDQLTAVNGTPITYDNIGNPTDDGTWEYEWEKGRQLKKMVKTGETVEFKYNENGLRIQKVATSTGTTNYTLHGKNIMHMTQGSNTLHFFYDASNRPAIVEFNGEKYAYVHNLQGDIVAILDSDGTAVVQYKYDAWGRPISTTGTLATTLGKLNPFRYRGYVYDEETGLYYLRSRYYDPTRCRFVNSDTLFVPNLFNYCDNKPINAADPSGHFYSTLYEYAKYHSEINADEYGIGELRGNHVCLRSTPCEDSSVPVIEVLDASRIDAFYIKQGAYMVEGAATSPYVKNSTPGRVWVEVMIFYYYDDQLADYDYIPPDPLVGYIAADYVLDMTNNVLSIQPGIKDLNLRRGPGEDAKRKTYLNSSDNVTSHVAEYYQQEVNGVSWSYVNSYYGCGWVKSEFIGLWN